MMVWANKLLLHGNVGATNGTGNFTVNAGNTLTLASNISVFNTSNLTLSDNSILNLGNSTTGYNRGSTDSLLISSNISVGSNSTVNIGNGTTLAGVVYGSSDGAGTLNIQGNVTSGGGYGQAIEGNDRSLAVINISEDNTLTLQHNASRPRRSPLRTPRPTYNSIGGGPYSASPVV